MWQLFDNKGAWVGSCSIEPDHADLAERGDFAVRYDSTGAVLMADPNTQEVTQLPEAPDTYHVWDGKKWVLTLDAAAQQLADAHTAKYAQINTAAQAFISAAAELDKVPEFEIKTWERQAAEAEAWAADATTPTPTLAQIAASRGIDLNDLREKALKKARQYSVLTATVAGQRQAFVDALNSAKTVPEIEAVIPVYKVQL